MNFIQQAYKAKNDWWIYLVTMRLIFIFWQIIGIIPLSIAGYLRVDNLDDFLRASKDGFATIGLNSNLYLALALLSLIMGLVGLLLGIYFVHKRKIKTLVTSRFKIDWKRVFFAFILWFLIFTTFIVLEIYLDSENLVWNFKPVQFVILVFVSFIFLPLQISFEELLFRGYLMQGIGILAKNRWFPLFFTSVLFGLMHGLNPEVEKLGWGIMVFYIGTGLLFGITTLLDEGTELALGMHAANNIVAAIFITSSWSVLQTDALYIDISEPTLNWEIFAPVFVLYPIIVFIFSKKYGWKSWKEKLLGTIKEPTLIEESI